MQNPAEVFADVFEHEDPVAEKAAEKAMDAAVASLAVGQTRALLVAALRELNPDREVLGRVEAAAKNMAVDFNRDVESFLEIGGDDVTALFTEMAAKVTKECLTTAAAVIISMEE